MNSRDTYQNINFLVQTNSRQIGSTSNSANFITLIVIPGNSYYFQESFHYTVASKNHRIVAASDNRVTVNIYCYVGQVKGAVCVARIIGAEAFST